MTEITTPPPPETITVNCPIAKAGFTVTNPPPGATLTISGTVSAGGPTTSCTVTLP
jgi:hypothetical protein